MDVSAYEVLSTIAIAFLALMLILALFEPGLPYKINGAESLPTDSARFRRPLAALAERAGRGVRVNVRFSR